MNNEQRNIFGMVFLLAQRWQGLGDKHLASEGITTKQWFLLVVMHTLFSTPPSLNDLAEAMGTSRQNVKQLALNLQRRGFVKIFSDAKDKRVLRFQTTSANDEFWSQRSNQDEKFIASLFRHIPDDDLNITHGVIAQLLKTTENN